MANQAKVLLGAEGIKKAYGMTFNTTAMAIKCLSKNYRQVLGSWFDDEYWPKVLNSAIKTREILLNTEANRQYASERQAKNQVAFLETSFQSESDFVIFDTMVILVSYNRENPFAVVIEDPETAKSLKGMFELLWRKADK